MMRLLVALMRCSCVALTHFALLPAAELPGEVRVSWIGNTYANGGGGSGPTWIPQDASDIAVADDGTVYTNVFWEEGGANQSAIRDGVTIAQARGSHGWGHEGGKVVACNARWLFFSQRFDNEGGGLVDPQNWPPKGSHWFGVARRSRADLRTGEPFAGGKGGRESPPGCFLPIHETADEHAAPTGLCANDDEVFVASAFSDEILVYSTASLALLRRFAVPDPGKLCLDRSGTLFVILDAGRSIAQYSTAGVRSPQTITLPAEARATALTCDRAGRLLVADAGPANRIRVYALDESAPRELPGIGIEGGIFAGPIPGRSGPLRFNHITGLGCDAAGRLYVASSQGPGMSGLVLEAYTPEHTLAWQTLGLEFVDRLSDDPGDRDSLFSKETRYACDWSQSPGHEARYAALTLDARAYPWDPRLGYALCSPQVVRIAGQPFMFLIGQNAGNVLGCWRFAPRTVSEIAIPCALFATKGNGSLPDEPAGSWLWRDGNGDSQVSADEYHLPTATRIGVPDGGMSAWVAPNGDVWFAGPDVRRFPCTGLSAQGVPQWDLAAGETHPAPAPFTAVRRLRYDAAHDIMYLGGTTAEHRNRHWKPMGPVFGRISRWSAGNRTPDWITVGTYDADYTGGHVSCEPISFDVAGEYVFVALAGASEKLGVGWGTVEVYDAAAGTLVGRLTLPAAFGQAGLLDMVEGLCAFQSSDGEYRVLIEEDLAAKGIMYRWRPVKR